MDQEEPREPCCDTTRLLPGVVASQLGLPSPKSDLYEALVTIVQKSLLAGTGITLTLEGNKIVISMTGGLIEAGENIVVTANPDGTYTVAVRDGLVEGGVGTSVTEEADGTYVVDFNGIESTPTISVEPSDDPYRLNLAAGALVAGNNVTITQAPNGVFTINSLTAGLLFWIEQYNAAQGITSWDAVNSSIAAFRNVTGLTLNKATLADPGLEQLGTDSVDFHQGQLPTFTATGNNSGILSGANNLVSGGQSAIAAGFNGEVTGSSSFIGAGTANRVTGSASAVTAGSNNVARGVSNGVLAGSSNDTGSLWTNSAIIAGSGNGAVVIATDAVSDSLIGAGTGNTLTDGTSASFIGAGTSHSVGGVACGIMVGSTGFVSGTASGMVAGTSNAITGGDTENCMLGAGSSNLVDDSVASGIFVGQGNTVQGALASAVVAGMSNTVASPVSNSVVLAGTLNAVNGAGTNSSVLSGNNVTINVADTHNLTAYDRKAQVSGSSAGGSHVTMQASHSLAMGHELTVSSEADSSFTSGSYLHNVSAHSTLLGLHAESSHLHESSLTLGRGTLGDRRTVIGMGLDAYNKGSIVADSLVLSGSSIAYFFRKSPDWKSEDDEGYFVALDGEGRVYPTSSPEDALGVTAPRDGLILNGAEHHWHGKYLKDALGRYITRLSYVDSFLEHLARLSYDPIVLPEQGRMDGNHYRALVMKQQEQVVKERRLLRDSLYSELPKRDDASLVQWVLDAYSEQWPELMRLARVELVGRAVPQLNPLYRPDELYVPRTLRVNEWVPVVQRGVAKVRSDGTCAVGKKCSVSGGLASSVGDASPWGVLSVEEEVVTIIL